MRTGICALLATALIAVDMPRSAAQALIRGVVTNVRSTLTGGSVQIVYDLATPKAGLAFDVSIEASEDGGTTFPIKLSSVTGDVGAGVIPGTSKRVVWNAARDVERAAFDKFQYRVTATAVERGAASTAKPATSAGRAPTTPPASGGGGKMKWVLIGGGVAAAGAAAALVASSAPVVPTGNLGIAGVTDALLASANLVTFSVSGASAAGESLTAMWEFGDGTSGSAAVSNGNAQVTKNYSSAGTFTPRVTLTASGGGRTVQDYRSITVTTVTGRWNGRFVNISGNFTLNLTQNGSQVTGDGVTEFTSSFVNPGRITGTVSGPPSRIVFSLASGDGRGAYDIEVTGSADQRTFTGTILTAGGQQAFSMTKQ